MPRHSSRAIVLAGTRLLALLILVNLSWTARADEVHFSRDVVPLLTKLGCNGGACHGSFQGRGGFRLSLLGFDPRADYDALVREARGRRVSPSAPENSLLLTKPTMTVPHGGKQRLTVGTEGYRILRDWVAQGSPPPPPKSGGVLRLYVVPEEMILNPDQERALQVKAVWADGVTQDATGLALFESTRDRVASIDGKGLVKARQAGRSVVTIRYQGQVAAVPVTVPFSTDAAPLEFPRNNYVDELLANEWQKVGLQPGPLASDAEFLRRVFLDLIGTLPTRDEVQRFLNSRDKNKRALIIDELLERPEYVDYWALKWGDLLRIHRRALGEKGLASFNSWLRQALRENRPFDQVVRDLLTAQGNLYTNGPVAFYFVDQTPEDLAETTAQVFLGIRLQCAKCHHHPFEVWGQDDYYGMAAFFARVQRKDSGDSGRFGGAQSLRLLSGPALAKSVAVGGKTAVRVPGGSSLKGIPANPNDPRSLLAGWLTRKDNPFFARNVTNRYWGYLFGRGLVDPIDDLRATNPATHPALLDALAEDWATRDFDVKHLLRTLCNARAYQLASDLDPGQDRDGLFYVHRRPRRLPAEVLLDAINQAAGVEEAFANLPPGTRAIALPDPSVVSDFLDTFGRPKRTSTCECERGNGADLTQVLHLINSETLHVKVTAPKGRVARLLAAKKTDQEIVEDLYLATLSRQPDDREREVVRKVLASASSRQEAFEDLLWTLINCAEFISAH